MTAVARSWFGLGGVTALLVCAGLSSVSSVASLGGAAAGVHCAPKSAGHHSGHSALRMRPGAPAMAEPYSPTPAEGRAAEQALQRHSAEDMSSAPQQLQRGGGSHVVDVYVHVLRTKTEGGIRPRRINKQIRRLNAAFAGRQSSHAARVPFHFRLRKVDVTVNRRWYRMEPETRVERRAKRSLYVGRHNGRDLDHLNLYVGDLPAGLLGWAILPQVRRHRGLPVYLDGVVLDRDTLPGGNLLGFNRGDTAVHEVGHWLGLMHTFRGRCGSRGDRVKDTPAETYVYGVTGRCDSRNDTCPGRRGRDPVHNFMNYTPDPCMTTFSTGQGRRAVQVWKALRT